MRAARLLSIQMMLDARGQVSASELARALEISVRTVHRDIDHLSSAGVPVVAARGRSGGFRLLEGWNTRLTGLTASEAQAVFLSGLAGPAAELGMRQPMQSAQLKLLASLPASSREEAQRMQSRLHLDPVDWYKEPAATPHLAVVAEAVRSDRKLAFRYQGWKGASARVTSPLGLVLKAGTWYFVGHEEDEFRTYRVAGISDPRLLAERARRPRKFDLARHWQAAVGNFERAIYGGTARVLATSSGLEALRLLNAATARAVAAVPPPAKATDRVSVRIPIESIESAAGQLLALGADVEVTQPRELRRAVRRRLRELARAYFPD
jgi:predicted DNA-binding transcriptional regulator YafY